MKTCIQVEWRDIDSGGLGYWEEHCGLRNRISLAGRTLRKIHPLRTQAQVGAPRCTSSWLEGTAFSAAVVGVVTRMGVAVAVIGDGGAVSWSASSSMLLPMSGAGCDAAVNLPRLAADFSLGAVVFPVLRRV